MRYFRIGNLFGLVTGYLIASIGSGRLLSRIGRYKVFPLVGSTAVLGALFLLANLGPDTSMWLVGLCLFTFGGGLGCSTQTVATAVLNSVPSADVGSAAGSVAFFRQLGGTIGTAVCGGVLAARLREQVAGSYAEALHDTLLVGVPFAAASVAVIVFLDAGSSEPSRHDWTARVRWRTRR